MLGDARRHPLARSAADEDDDNRPELRRADHRRLIHSFAMNVPKLGSGGV
jgi:hypothetical protein